MKKLYILAAGMIVLLAACSKDKSSSADHPLPEVVIDGMATTYTAYTSRDVLHIDPVVTNENMYDYYWTLFPATFTPGQGFVNVDTIARTKKLDYEVLDDPGPYLLVFNAREKRTGVTKLTTANLTVSTLNMNGWYLVKDHAGKTDMDFIYTDGRINNWIANYNGSSLDGNSVKAIFAPNFKMAPNAAAPQFNALMVLSENDAAVYRVDNGKMMLNFDNMFFDKPAVRKPQGVFQPNANMVMGVINDNKLYMLNKGSRFIVMPPPNPTVSPVTAVAGMGMCFDQEKKEMILVDNVNLANLPSYATGKLKNMNAVPMWMAGYTGTRSIVMALFRNPQDSGYLYKIDAHFPQLYGSNPNMFLKLDTLAPDHGLMHASKIAGNYDDDFLYYALNNRIYMLDVMTLVETPQLTIPAGETVTCMQHVKYPQPGSGTNTVDVFAVATHSNGRYKVYLHKLTSTGTIQAAATPQFEGEGRVNSVIYMEQGNGSRIF